MLYHTSACVFNGNIVPKTFPGQPTLLVTMCRMGTVDVDWCRSDFQVNSWSIHISSAAKQGRIGLENNTLVALYYLTSSKISHSIGYDTRSATYPRVIISMLSVEVAKR